MAHLCCACSGVASPFVREILTVGPMKHWRWWWSLWLVGLIAVRVQADGCVGDCNRDGAVTIEEIVRGVNIALGNAGVELCPGFDRNGDGTVAIDEIVAAVGFLLNGCPLTSTPTPTLRATPTPTPRENRAPIIQAPRWYRGYANQPIALPLGVLDPDGDSVECMATRLPAGAVLDPSWRLVWMPSDADVGNHDVEVECADQGVPPARAQARMVVSVWAVDACSVPQCDPAVGCSRALPSLDAPCCGAEHVATPSLPDVPCPDGLALWISEDIDGGFRPLNDCDLKYVRNNAQASAEVRFKFRARCLSLDDRILLEARMDTKDRQPVIEEQYRVRFYPAEGDGDIVESRSVQFEVKGPSPFFDMEGAEANLEVSVTDGQLHHHTERLRLRLTFTPVPQ